MASIVADAVLDAALNNIKTNATHINICSADPTTYTEATSTYFLGAKNFGAGSCFTGPAARSPNGRKISSVAITDGVVSTSGTVAKWAVTNNTGSTLLLNGANSSSQAVTSGNPFTLSSFDFGFANQ